MIKTKTYEVKPGFSAKDHTGTWHGQGVRFDAPADYEVPCAPITTEAGTEWVSPVVDLTQKPVPVAEPIDLKPKKTRNGGEE